MIAVPAVDLRDGACVQLVGGRFEDERVRLPDPARVAAEWREAGFAELHVVDLDAALGRGANEVAIGRILAERGETVVQVGGGLRTDEAVARRLDAGAARVVVGTRGVAEPAWLEGLAARYPGRVVLAADVRGTTVVTHGWAEASGLELDALLDRVAGLPLGGVLVTAVHQEGRLAGPDLDLVAGAARRSAQPVQASGGIRDVEDLRRLAAAGAARAVVGMAFYTGLLDRGAVAKEFGR